MPPLLGIPVDLQGLVVSASVLEVLGPLNHGEDVPGGTGLGREDHILQEGGKKGKEKRVGGVPLGKRQHEDEETRGE